MGERVNRCLCISSFNINNLAGYLASNEMGPALDVTVAPYGQVMQLLVDPSHDLWLEKPNLTVVWTQPEAVIAAFQNALRGESVDVEALMADVDAFCQLLLHLQGRTTTVFVPSWTIPPSVNRSPLIDLDENIGITSLVMQMNLRLAHNLKETPGYFVLDAQRWQQVAGTGAYSAKLWYLAKVPFSHAVFKEAAKDITSAIRTLYGDVRKMIILDLDNTLWGGIVGDDGWQNLILGGHSPWGEAYRDFQLGLQALKRRGVLLAIVSKNEESVALDAIQRHPEMILKADDFVGWKINWRSKAENIAELVHELNLGLQSVVFIDDNPVERDAVRQLLPEVLVPEWPADSLFYAQSLTELRCFISNVVSDEDRERAHMYAVERQRQQARAEIGSLADWLESLDIHVGSELLSESNLPRVCQLLNKTNQMNMTTRRLSETELMAWAAEPTHHMWAFRVTDRFGDLGLTGIVSLEQQRNRGRIVDFVLSCRAMGRNIEEVMLGFVTEQARALGLSEVYGAYVPTDRNKPCFDLLKRSGFVFRENRLSFHWSTDLPYPTVAHVTVEFEELRDSSRKVG